MKFDKLELALENPAEVTELHLSRAAQWPEAHFPNLRRLDLSFGKIDCIPDRLTGFEQLEELNLSGNNLERLSPGFFQLSQLKRIDLRFNPGSQFRLDDFAAFPTLESLRLPYTTQTDGFPPWLCQRSELQELDLSGVVLGALPAAIGQLQKLRLLNLANCQLSHLPAELVQLAALQELDLESAQVSQLPDGFGQLANLRILNLFRVPLQQLPSDFGRLNRLEKLVLESSELRSESSSWQGLTALKEVRIWQTPLPESPEWLAQLRHIESLDLSRCRLHRLPEDLSGWSRLFKLELEECGLSQLPESISALSSLTHANFKKNPLTRLPSGLGNLPRLEVLTLDGCSLPELPASLGQLAALRCLYLAHNPLSQLPAEFANLGKLEALSLAHSSLTGLPEWLLQLPALRSLSLTGLSFIQAEADKVLAFQKQRRASVDLPRIVAAPKKVKVSSSRLAPKVVTQIKRLGGTLQNDSVPVEPATAIIGGKSHPLPEALRQWRDRVRFQGSFSGPLGGLNLRGLYLGYVSMSEGYEAFNNTPYLELGHTADGCLLLAELGGKSPADPLICYLDHDSFWETRATAYGVKLSEFLSGLQPE